MYRGKEGEQRVLVLAREHFNVRARAATPEEDHGYQKADVVLEYYGKVYPIQVSRQQKSKRARALLEARGTYVLHTHDAHGNFCDMQVRKSLATILGRKNY